MRVRYSQRAARFMGDLRTCDETQFHSLRGLILQIAGDPSIDNVTKILTDFGSGTSAPVYMDEDWWIVYRVDREQRDDIMSVISIWSASSPPHLRL